MCNAACIDEAINSVHIEMYIFSASIDTSETLSLCPSQFFILKKLSYVFTVSRGKRVWETSRMFWIHTKITVSRGWLNRITSGFCTPFALVPLLRISRTLRTFRISRRILSRRYAVPLDETTRSCFHHWRTWWRAFLRSFRHLRLLSVGKKKMAVGKSAAGKCGVARYVEKMQQIRSLFLIILLNHLPQEIQILHLFGSSGLLLHWVFCDTLLMRPTSPILQYQQSECLLTRFFSRSKQMLDRFLVIPSFWIDEFSLCLSRRLGDVLPVHRME